MTCRSKLLLCAGLGLLVFLAMTSPAKADLTGTTVTGSLQFDGNPLNYYDPANGFVPAGYQNSAGAQNSNTVTIVGGNEFGYHDAANTDVTSFSSTGFTFTDTSVGGGTNIILTMTDSAFAGVSLISSTFSGLTYGISGDEITVDIPAFSAPGGQVYTAAFNVAQTPEPSTLLLLSIGMVGLIGLGYKR